MDRRTDHVSAMLERLPEDGNLRALLNDFDAREVLHVTFGSALAEFGVELKAALANFTQWLAIHMAQNYSPRIRVNALAPGFFLTEQNRFLLTDPNSGGLTARGKSILAHTPMNRFGIPEDLLGATMWLISPAASFVTEAVIPIDGGFSAFSGV
jgi:NAD(P)-dependent dehydrogenase (short-subunit alcohol dehydrogenase family)